MSVRVLADVFARSASKGSARLVLLALADVANDEGEVTAYKRSHRILAAKANIDAKTVPRAIAALVDLGEVVVLEAGAGRRSADYRITLPAETPHDAGTPSDAPPDPAPRGDTPRTTRGQTPSDAGSIIPSPPSSSAPSQSRLDLVVPDPFDVFWDAWPRDRRVAKKDARTAWDRALKAGATPDDIIAGARRYAEETADRPAAERRFVKTPAPWLNGSRWLDEPGANRTTHRPRSGPAAAPTARAGETRRMTPEDL